MKKDELIKKLEEILAENEEYELEADDYVQYESDAVTIFAKQPLMRGKLCQ